MQEVKRDEYLKEKVDVLTPFLPEIEAYFAKKEQGIVST